jgi:hypothetical protein
MPKPVTLLSAVRAPALILAFAMTAAHPAYADGPLGLYVGGAIARGQVEASLPVLPYNAPVPFDRSHTAYSAVLGIRPIRYVGAEIGYTDFGRISQNFYNDAISGSASLKADTAFAVFYLPVSAVDFYAKLGVARLQSSASATENVEDNVCIAGGPCGGTFTHIYSQTSTNFASGVGAQFKVASWGPLGSLAVRIEYERFNFAGENPNLVCAGATWTFF